ncbi:MAG: PEGA domain-containing protein, partial [Planctomycetes bacterium]|nr:PEGA domain-containing protein [Planctomycetota bacterium]
GWALYGPAHLSVRTDPPDADIYLDGERAGTGEIDVMVWPPGERKVEARRQGHAPAEWTIRAASGGRYEKTLELARLAGTVRVESTPAGAEIWLDGLPTDSRTSADLAGVAEGTHAVALRMEGYEEAVLADVRVEHGRTVRAAAVLVPAGGEVRIAASPPGTRGELSRWQGAAFECEREFASGFEGKLPAGRWQVTLHGPGGPERRAVAARE